EGTALERALLDRKTVGHAIKVCILPAIVARHALDVGGRDHERVTFTTGGTAHLIARPRPPEARIQAQAAAMWRDASSAARQLGSRCAGRTSERGHQGRFGAANIVRIGLPRSRDPTLRWGSSLAPLRARSAHAFFHRQRRRQPAVLGDAHDVAPTVGRGTWNEMDL